MKKRNFRIVTVMITVLIFALGLTGCGKKKTSGNTSSQIDLKDVTYEAEEYKLSGIEGSLDSIESRDGKLIIYTSDYVDKTEYPDDWVDGMPPETEETSSDFSDDTEDAVVEDSDADTVSDDASENTEADADTSDDAGEDPDTEGAAKATIDEDMDSYADSYMEDDPYDDVEYKYEYTNKVYLAELDGSDPKEIASFTYTGEDEYSVSTIRATSEGKVYALLSKYDDNTGKQEFKIAIYEGGKQKEEFSLTDLLGEIGDDVYVQDVKLDKTGLVYLSCETAILVIDDQARKIFDIKIPEYYDYLANDKDGNVICSLYEGEERKVKRIDPEKKGFSDDVAFSGSMGNLIPGFGAYDFFYNDGSGIVGADFNGTTKTLLNWVASNIDSQYIYSTIALSQDQFLAVYNDYSSEDSEQILYRLNKVDPAKIASKVAITYGGIWLSENIKSQAIRYNKSQDKYQIIIKDYSNYDDPTGKFNADLLAGDVPDIMDLSSVPVEKYISKGLLEDLYPLIDADKELSRDDFLESPLKAMETDGKLYFISPYFSVNLMAGYKSDVGDKKSLKIDDIMDLEKKYDGARAFSQYATKQSVLNVLVQCNYDSYIDWSTGKCNFDNDDFVKVLEYAASYPNEEDIDYEDSYDEVKNIRDHKQLLTEIYSMSYEEIELYDALYEKNAAFIGYPSASDGIGMNVGYAMGIYSKSSVKEGAWDFIRQLLKRDYISDESKSGYYNGFPIRKDSLEDALKKYTTTKTYKDDFGNEVEPLSGSWGYGDLEVQMKPLNDEQVGILRDIIDSVSYLITSYSEIDDIMNEETGALFSGQKSAKDVAGIIQNRISTYVSENR